MSLYLYCGLSSIIYIILGIGFSICFDLPLPMGIFLTLPFVLLTVGIIVCTLASAIIIGIYFSITIIVIIVAIYFWFFSI